MALPGIEKVGNVKGFGFELMDSFLDCIKQNPVLAIEPVPMVEKISEKL